MWFVEITRDILRCMEWLVEAKFSFEIVQIHQIVGRPALDAGSIQVLLQAKLSNDLLGSQIKFGTTILKHLG